MEILRLKSSKRAVLDGAAFFWKLKCKNNYALLAWIFDDIIVMKT